MKNWLSWLGIGVSSIVLAASLYSIHQNLETDNIDGRGYMYPSADCRHVGPSDNGYLCQGMYYQDGGMIEIPDASVHTKARYLKGQFIDDIWRDTNISYQAAPNVQRYVTGDERRSLIHNLPATLGIVFGLELAALCVWLLLAKKGAVKS